MVVNGKTDMAKKTRLVVGEWWCRGKKRAVGKKGFFAFSLSPLPPPFIPDECILQLLLLFYYHSLQQRVSTHTVNMQCKSYMLPTRKNIACCFYMHINHLYMVINFNFFLLFQQLLLFCKPFFTKSPHVIVTW